MLVVRLDLHGGTLTYASAGHIPGVLLNGSGGIDCILDSTGVPLGLFADANFATRNVQFRAQQILVLGTDGATETSDSNGSEFGRSGVLEYVRTHASDTAHDIAAGVYHAARSFAAAEQQHDDITSVIVKIRDAAFAMEEASVLSPWFAT
jgi:sigma-B regulation protein RsbU (phosphoserine phosphatase)